MPNQKIVKKAKADARQGKSASTQAGEFVKDEIDRIRAGKHGVRSAKQAIAIGLSEARRAGVNIPKSPSKKKAAKKVVRAGSRKVNRKVARKSAPKTSSETSARRSQASLKALKREPTSSVSPKAMSRFAKSAAKKRSPISRSQSAKRAAYTRAHHLA